MTDARSKHLNPEQPLSQAEILEAIKASGYPFEVKLLRLFKAAGLHASIGVPRPTIPDGEVKEIDITAQVSRHVTVDGELLQAEIYPFVAAKKLNPPRCFIGVAGDADPGEVIVRAGVVSGVPTYGYTPGIPADDLAVLLMNGGFFDAFQLFCGRPRCAHWAIGDRKEKNGAKKPWAEGDPRFWNDFDVLQRAIKYDASLFARAPLKTPRHQPMAPHLKFHSAALVVDTDALHLYDPDTDTLKEVHWLTYRPLFGMVIDVVSRDGVAELLKVHNAVADRLMDLVVRHASTLRAYATAQKVFWDDLSDQARAAIAEAKT